MTQCDSLSSSPQPDGRSTPPGGLGRTLPTLPETPGGRPPGLSLLNHRPGTARVRDVCPPSRAQGDVQAGFLGVCSAEACAGGAPAVTLTVGAAILLFGRETLALQESSFQRCRNRRLRKTNGKTTWCWPEGPWADQRPPSSVTALPAGDLASGAALPSCSSRGSPRAPCALRQPSRPHTCEGSFPRAHGHLPGRFPPWGDEAACCAVRVSGVHTAVLLLNSMLKAFSGRACRGRPHLGPRICSQLQPQPFPQPRPHPLPLPLPPPRPQLRLPSPLPILPPHPPPQVRSWGAPCAQARPRPQPIWGSHVDIGVCLIFVRGSWGFPTEIHAVANCAIRRPSRAQVSVSILPGGFPIPPGQLELSGEPRQGAEPQLTMGRSLPRWGLPRHTPDNGPEEPLLKAPGSTAHADLLRDGAPDPHSPTVAVCKNTVASGPSAPETPPGRDRASENDHVSQKTSTSETSRTPLLRPRSRVTRAVRYLMGHLCPCAYPREQGSPVPRALRNSPEPHPVEPARGSTSTTKIPKKAWGKFSQAKFRQHARGADIPGPPEPCLSPEKVGSMEGKAEARAPAGPTRARPRGLSCRARCCLQRQGQTSPQGVRITADDPPTGAPRGEGAPSKAQLQASPWPGAPC